MSKKKIIILIVVAVLLGAALFVSIIIKRYLDRPVSTVEINGQTVKVELAEEPFKKMVGLSGRRSMPDNEGMVFTYLSKGIYEFWMKGMRFPLDFIWLDDWKVVDITRNVPPQGGSADPNLKRYTPKTEINAMIELNAGLADKWGIKEGMTVKLNKVSEDK